MLKFPKLLIERGIGAREWDKIAPSADSKKNLQEVEELEQQFLVQVGGGTFGGSMG